MGTLDEFKEAFGPTALDRPPDRQPDHVWGEVCVCGHLSRYHPPVTGGSFPLPEPQEKSIGGRPVVITTVLAGCVGALRPRGFVERTATEINREAGSMTEQINVTCPCTSFRPVAQVDRPNRFFNQRIPKDLDDPLRHPFSVGIRAFRTHLGKRRAALSDPSWADREFERRFLWLDGKRVCGLSKCTTTDGVWPQFVRPDGLSELRCAAHR